MAQVNMMDFPKLPVVVILVNQIVVVLHLVVQVIRELQLDLILPALQEQAALIILDHQAVIIATNQVISQHTAILQIHRQQLHPDAAIMHLLKMH